MWDRSSDPRRTSNTSKFSSLPHDVPLTYNWIFTSVPNYAPNPAPTPSNPPTSSHERRRRRRLSNPSDPPNHQNDHQIDHQISSPLTDLPNDLLPHHPSLEKDEDYDDEEEGSNDNEDVDEDDEERADEGDDDSRVDQNHSDSSCDGRFSRRRRRKRKGLGRGASGSESERYSMPRSSSVSVERFSMRANCDSSDFSRANSTSNERFHSDFSLAVASASSNDRVSAPTSDPFSIRNLDFAASAFSLGRADSCSERFSDVYSKNSDFSTRNSTDFRTQSEEEERFSDDSLEEMLRSVPPPPPPPPPMPPLESICKRHSIAWEVSMDEDPLYAPGSTKVVGRRRRRSSDVSSEFVVLIQFIYLKVI